MNIETQNQIDADPEFSYPPPEVSQDLNPYQAFEDAFMIRVRAHFVPAGVAPEDVEKFGRGLCLLIEESLAKFARGQQEHGGSIFDGDNIFKLGEELIDMMMYFTAHRITWAKKIAIQI